MHELLLYGQVPAARHEQVLKILAGIAAMQPRIFHERQLVYKPLRPLEEAKVNKKFPNKPAKPQNLIYHRLVEQLTEDDFGKESPLMIRQSAKDTSEPTRQWTIRVEETPEPETKTLVMRPASETEAHDQILQRMADPETYSFVAESIAEGHRLVHKNLVITLSRLLRLPSSPQTSPSTVLPQLDALALVDPTGAFVLEARVRIEDRAKPTLVSAASDELSAFRELMRGSIDMRAPERLALDTRVR